MTRDLIERMDGLVPIKGIENMEDSVKKCVEGLLEEGFEWEEVYNYMMRIMRRRLAEVETELLYPESWRPADEVLYGEDI